ncbi:uncharacterized protein [Rutidosis leptorrhynchoides]|uniref:uncharacterized protein n=1 Tax=Rutidosis leptorrhynchoides TaxID=125765 RepID=UPI003A98EB18
MVVEGYLPESGYRIRLLHMDTESIKQGIRPSTMALSGFSGESAWPIGTLDLKLELRDENDKSKTRTEDVEFCALAGDVTKWAEAKLLNKITSKKVRDFFWKSIVCRFDIPNEIVSDNGTQFEGEPFRIGYPQANGQCEVTNRDIVHAIKARLGKQTRGWVDKLPKVLWEHRTTPKNNTRETPFSLVYGSEAVLPAEIAIPTKRTLSFSQDRNARDLRTNLDLMEEHREMAATLEAINKQKIVRYYHKRVRLIMYAVGDLVWHDNQESRIQDTGKLGPNWEGPYKVIGISKTGTHKLAELNGKEIKRI